ncbi:Fungal specific transcription factor domain-containing protein [Cladophialophora immunda]|nr:Fungal specific transcription factor domain-containing protein [Cladophialophora immunda]
MFNSTLVFHKPTFSRAWEEGRLARHVLLAVYATATIFLPFDSPLARQNASLLQSLGDLRALGRQWAIRAGKEVLQDIDQPTFESVQTCEMLTLYWFSAGESQRNTMFSGIAYKAACTLGLDSSEPSTATEDSPASGISPTWLEAEAVRRCFWAVWFTQCINSDHSVVGTTYNDRVMNLSLPIAESSFNEGVQQPLENLSSILQQHATFATQKDAAPSIMAELMTLIFYWVRIRNLVRVTDRISGRDWLAELFELEGRLSTWYSQLPDSLKYSKRNLYEQLVVLQQPVYTFVHALYHQCRLVLHSSLVPKFSGIRLDRAIPSEATALSARIALKSAQRISELGADILALDWDPAQIASFVGYCMYVSASIHIAFLCSRDATLAVPARANLMASLKLLKSMKMYWTNLQRLWVRINMLYGAQMSRRLASAREGMAGSTEPQAHFSELDEVAGEPRDVGQLAEPLADSVLDYTLRRLRPDRAVLSPAAQALERQPCPDDLSQLMGEDSSSSLNPSSQSARPEGPIPSMGLDQSNYLVSTAPQMVGGWDRMRTPTMQSLNNDGLDWWEVSLDNIQQPILPYEELFNLDFNLS